MIAKDLIGKEISEARKTLGYWWVISGQQVNEWGIGFYAFTRAGKGRVELCTDEEGRVKTVWPVNQQIDFPEY